MRKDDDLRRALTLHDQLKLVEPITRHLEVLKQCGQISGLERFVEDHKRQEALVRAAIGPIAALGTLRLDRLIPRLPEIDQATRLIAAYEARFRLPALDEAMRLSQQVLRDFKQPILQLHQGEAARIQNAIAAMRTPWLDAANEARSMASLAELQAIGRAISTEPAFDIALTEGLRRDLGDWRDPIGWPAINLPDVGTRINFYVDQGLDLALTDFPPAAFDEGLDIGGFRDDPPTLVAIYGPPVGRDGDEELEESFARTNLAHDWLQRFESELRRFIDRAMTAAFGSDWPHTRLPNGLYDSWRGKQERAEKAGRPVRPVICYADFTDYERVVCKQDNWREVFAPFFQRPEFFREAMQRLHQPRIETMHARPITQEDELYIYVEIRRLVRTFRTLA